MNDKDEILREIRSVGVLVEQMLDADKATKEMLRGVQSKLSDLPTLSDFDQLREDVGTIKSAVLATTRELHEHTGGHHEPRRPWKLH